MKNKKRILFVEDETDFRHAVRIRLEANGYEVIEAKDGFMALDLVRTEGPDLIILDVNLPKINGFEVARRLKADEKCRKIPIVMLTVRSQAVDKETGFAAGAEAYVIKPFESKELLGTISELVST